MNPHAQEGSPATTDTKRLELVLTWLTLTSFLAKAVWGDLVFQNIAVVFGMALFAVQLQTRDFKLSGVEFAILCLSLVIYANSLAVNFFSAGMYFLPQVIACTAVAIAIVEGVMGYRGAVLLFLSVLIYLSFALFYQNQSPDLLVAGSRNHVSTLVINLCILVYLCALLEDRKVSWLPALATFFICVASVGMTGILSSFVLFAGIFLFRVFGDGGVIRMIILSGVVALIWIVTDATAVNAALALVAKAYGLEGDIAQKLDLMKYLGEDVRFKIWAQYFNTMDIGNFFFGRDLNAEYAGHTNLHSSYLLFHARAGWLAFVVFGILFYILIKLFRTNIVLFICLVTLMLRAVGDTVMLGIKPFDWVLFVLIIMSFYMPIKPKTARAEKSSFMPREPQLNAT